MTQAVPAPITNLRFATLGDLVIEHKLWTNPRLVTGLDEESIGELGADIKARGIQVPLLVQKIWANADRTTFKNLVLEGQRRFLAANDVLSKTAEIPVIDRTVEPIELTQEASDALMLDMLAVATHREGLSSFELSEVADRLRKRGRKISEISKAIGRSEGWVSKFLTARGQATPKLVLKWRKGEITDEQFKELADVKEPERQQEHLDEVIKARKSGDLGEARLRAKEIQEAERQKKEADKRKDKEPPPAPAPTATTQPEPAAKPKPAKKPMTARIALEELVGMTSKRPPTHDYVKGIMHGVAYALGEIGPDEFLRPWTAYLARVDGSGTAPKKSKSKKKPAKKKSKAKK